MTILTEGVEMNSILEKRIVYVFTHPEELVYSSDRKYFETYLNTWSNEQDVYELWQSSVNSYFPFEHEKFNFLNSITLVDLETLAQLCDLLKVPYMLADFFAGCVYHYRNVDVLEKLLQYAPLATVKNSDIRWNQSFVAPLLLHALVSRSLQVTSSQKNITAYQYNEKKWRSYFNKIGAILRKRTDGYFLVWNYIRFLEAKKHNNNEMVSLCKECLGRALIVKEKRFLKKNPLEQLFPCKKETIKTDFCETGLPFPEQEKSVCLAVLTHLQFFIHDKNKYNDIIQDLLACFEASLSIQDSALPCYEAIPFLCHYDSAQLYLTSNSGNYSERWKCTWQQFANAQRRIAYCHYSENSIELQNNIKFLLLVGRALLQYVHYYKEYEEEHKLWDILWDIAKDNLQNRETSNNEFTVEFARFLVLCKARYNYTLYPTKANDMTVQYFVTFVSFPKLLILSLSSIQTCSFFNAQELKKEQRHDLRVALEKALKYCENVESETKLHMIGIKCLHTL